MSDTETTPTDSPDQEERDPRPARPAWARRVAPLLLIGGLLVAAATVLPHVPKERRVEIRLDDSATVVGLELAWTGLDGASVQGSSWRFPPGAAPSSLDTTVRLPDGSYSLEITVDRTLGRGATRRSITLDEADQITVPVR